MGIFAEEVLLHVTVYPIFPSSCPDKFPPPILYSLVYLLPIS